MSARKGTAITIIAIIVAGLGLGLATFTLLTLSAPQRSECEAIIPEEGLNTYYCSTGQEIQSAIKDIGFSNGLIIITNNITLNDTIQINGTGNYVIQGAGSLTIDTNFVFEIFHISSALSCTIRDLILDGSKNMGSLPTIIIDEEGDNPVYIQNVRFFDGGLGIEVHSNNVWIRECTFSFMVYGISCYEVEWCHIIQNKFYGIAGTAIEGNTILHTNIEGNNVDVCDEGIFCTDSRENTITGNIIQNLLSVGIDMTYASSSNIISGNSVLTSVLGPSGNIYGILIALSDYNIVMGNLVTEISASMGTGYGLALETGSEENVVMGNNLYGNDYNLVLDNGSDNIKEHNNES